jgi:uncharacterized protein YdeI (YjbR/CyaY-like superfamily)
LDPGRAHTKDPEEWLDLAPAFSSPLVAQLRDWVQSWEPDLTESIKWNNLCFSGRKLVCGLSACKHHAGLAFFRGTELPDPQHLLAGAETNTSILSMRLTTLEGLNRQALRRLLHAAVELDADPAIPLPSRQKREQPEVPDFLAKALARNRKAGAGFAALAPSYRREYLVWLTTAKRPGTRSQRLQQTLHALAHGRKWAQRKEV